MPTPGRPAGPWRPVSRNVILTATFLALAAGGTAACDAPPEEVADPQPESWDPGSAVAQPAAPVDEDDDEVFYCADEDGVVVDAKYCDRAGSHYLLWHSAGYPRGLRAGSHLRGGDHFAPGDRAARKAYRLPVTGRVANGTVKTNVVGQASTNRAGTSQGSTNRGSSGQGSSGQGSSGQGSSGFTGDGGGSAGG